ncbi:hypothetical protein QJS66_01445 [Kocuria rhizophila]|nr:hypothetical protein QJS66_01445 [Kocuria rhizophila]
MVPRCATGAGVRSCGHASRGSVPDVRPVLSVPGGKRWALVAVPLVALGSAAVWSLVTPALVDAGWSLGSIGTVTSVIAAAPALAAAPTGGRPAPYPRSRHHPADRRGHPALRRTASCRSWSGAELATGRRRRRASAVHAACSRATPDETPASTRSTWA